jgi:hypothetical protein
LVGGGQAGSRAVQDVDRASVDLPADILVRDANARSSKSSPLKSTWAAWAATNASLDGEGAPLAAASAGPAANSEVPIVTRITTTSARRIFPPELTTSKPAAYSQPEA